MERPISKVRLKPNGESATPRWKATRTGFVDTPTLLIDSSTKATGSIAENKPINPIVAKSDTPKADNNASERKTPMVYVMIARP